MYFVLYFVINTFIVYCQKINSLQLQLLDDGKYPWCVIHLIFVIIFWNVTKCYQKIIVDNI